MPIGLLEMNQRYSFWCLVFFHISLVEEDADDPDKMNNPDDPKFGEDDEKDEEEDDEDLPAPQVRIGEDGQLVLDQSSLVNIILQISFQ